MQTSRKTFESLESRLFFSAAAAATGLRGDYYSSPTEVFSNNSVAVQTTPINTETDPAVAFNWSTAPASEIRWSGSVTPTQTGSYVFHVTTGAAVRLWVNGQEIINNWQSQSNAADDASTAITLTAGTQYDFRLDVNESGAGSPGVELDWTLPDGSRQVVPSGALTPFSQALNITSGGLYVGSWETTDPTATTVADSTTQPVIIDGSIVEGSGRLIQNHLVQHSQISILNTTATSLVPTVAGVAARDFVYLQGPANVDIEHDTITAPGGYGIDIYGFTGTGSQTIKILYNTIRNADGRYSNGNGGYESAGPASHAIGIQNVYGISNMEIGWNQIIDAPNQSWVNDVVNLFDVQGIAASPVEVDNNYIRGLYSLDIPTTWDSGSGITTDGNNVYSTEPAYINIDNNQVVSTGSAGIGVPTGHDVQVFDNRLINPGYIQGNTPVFASGTGVYIVDLGHVGSGSFYNNGAHDNVSGWIQPPHSQQNGGNTSVQKDFSLLNQDPTMTYGNSDWSGTINAAAKVSEWGIWQAKLLATNTTLGPMSLGASSYSIGSAAAPAATPVIASPAPPAVPVSNSGITSLILDANGGPLLLAA